MDQREFMTYLATGEAPVKAEVTVVETVKIDPIDLIVANLCTVGMLAKDLHYRARGRAFYAIHLLADLVWEVRKSVDELLEVYYLGEKQTVPPLMAAYESHAAKTVESILGGVNVTADFSGEYHEDQILQALIVACKETAELVEQAKAKPLRSGTNAVLDEISKKALQNAGLLGRTDTSPQIEDSNGRKPEEQIVDLTVQE